MTNRSPYRNLIFIILCIPLLAGAGCRSVYYATWEKFGVEKRDLLKKRVTEARDQQTETGEQFKDALTRLKELTGFEGGPLEEAYTSLKEDYEACDDAAKAVRVRIKDMEKVASDLFEEWEKELLEIKTPSLQANSRQQLASTRKKYAELSAALNAAEKTMTPVLSRFNDYVLYLKHSLNARAIVSLKGEATHIEAEILKLIKQMNQSIAKADQFVEGL